VHGTETPSPPASGSKPSGSFAVGRADLDEQARAVPASVVALVAALLLGTASFLAARSLALAGDGAWYLVQILGTERVAGPDARLFGNAVRQAPVLLAARLGESDTHVLSILLGAGQLVLPAALWCLVLVLARGQIQAFCAVALTAGICAGTTWYFSVGENVVAVPLTVLVAVLLWRPEPWRARDVAVAVLAALVLVAAYEPSALTAPLLVLWAVWRGVSSGVRRERFGAAIVALLSAASALHGWWRIVEARDQENAQAFLNDILAVRPWTSFVALASGIALVYAMTLSPGRASRFWLALGVVCGGLAVVGLATTSYTEAYAARGAAVVAALFVELYLFGLWARGRVRAPAAFAGARSFGARGRWPLAVATVFVGAMVLVDLLRLGAWHESFSSFRAEVDRAHGTVDVDAVLPRDRRQVVFGWTSSSLSLVVRRSADSGVLVDPRPTFVPFPPDEARKQLDDRYRWGS
jgi:hypothetical protein